MLCVSHILDHLKCQFDNKKHQVWRTLVVLATCEHNLGRIDLRRIQILKLLETFTEKTDGLAISHHFGIHEFFRHFRSISLLAWAVRSQPSEQWIWPRHNLKSRFESFKSDISLRKWCSNSTNWKWIRRCVCIYIWGAVKIYYNCLVCFWRVIVFWGGPYRFTGFCCFRHHPSRS